MLTQTKSPGTGNSSCQVPKRRQVALNNTLITAWDVKMFKRNHGYERCRIILSNRRTKRTWGSAYPGEKRATLYRHSVWVFLHELAHLLVPPGSGHGIEFGSQLTRLEEQWTSWKGDL